MNDIEVSSIDLVEGGNVFKQGHYLTLGYVPRDEKGETVDLSGKTLNVSLWGRKGVVFEGGATYSGGVIRFTFDKLVAAGDYTVEFTATSSTDSKYRKKFPTNQHSGRIAIKQSADDLGVVGIQVYTVAQLKAEQKALLDVAVSGFTVDSETKMARVSGGTTYTSLPARLEADKQATALQLADKASKAELQQISLSFKESYATLTELQSEYPQGDNYNHAVLSDGFIYTWYADGAWVSTGLQANGTGVADGTITQAKTDFLNPNKNLYNPATRNIGSGLGAAGELYSDSKYDTSDYIAVKNGLPYPVTQHRRVAFYTAKNQGAFVRLYDNPVADSNRKQIITPDADGFIRVAFLKELAVSSMIEQNTTFTTFVEYGGYTFNEKLSGAEWGNKNITDVDGSKLHQKSIGINKLDFVEESKNKFNKNTVSPGYLNELGVAISNTGYKTSDFIRKETGKSYYIPSSRKINYYDPNKVHESGTQYDNTNQAPYVLNSTSDGYFRLSVVNEVVESLQVEEGTQATSYENYGFKMSNFIPETKNALKGKSSLNIGDSIAAGDGNNGIGYSEIIAAKNNMVVNDYAIGGATMLPVEGKSWILDQLNLAITNDVKADFVLFDGGTNDALRDPSLFGSISSGYTAELDTTTFCGSFETLCKTAKSHWHGAKIIYIRVNNISTRDGRQITLGNLAVEMCKKWGIPVVDLYSEGGLNTHIPIMKSTYTNLQDGTHPNKLGYETFYVPAIEAKMKAV